MAMVAIGRAVALVAQLSDANMALLLTGLLLGAVLLVGAVLIAWAARWRRQQESGTSASDQLAHFRTLYEQGAISQEEFNRLRSLLGGQLRAELKVPPKPSDPPPATPPNVSPPPPGTPPLNGAGPP